MNIWEIISYLALALYVAVFTYVFGNMYIKLRNDKIKNLRNNK